MRFQVWRSPFRLFRRTLAKIWLKAFARLIIVGVTGSFGKTSSVRAINQVLSIKFKTLQTDLNLDTIYNLPITILSLRPRHQALVLEYGVDHVGEMDYHLSLVKPQIGVVTGITPVHSDSELLGSLEGIIREKSKLLKVLPKHGWAILNYDDASVRKMASETQARIIWFGTNSHCDYWVDDIKVDYSGTKFTLHHNGEKMTVKIGLIGKHFVHSALIATAVGQIYKISIKDIIRALSELTPLQGRMSIEEGPEGTIILNDSLRANPASTISGLETLVALPCKGRRVAVLGEMGELGKSAEEEHRKVGEKIAGLKIDFFVAVGPLQRFSAQEAINSGMPQGRVFIVNDVFEASQVLKKILKKDDLLYLKASLLRHIERVIFLLRDEKVNCSQSVCHFYKNCLFCPLLRKEAG